MKQESHQFSRAKSKRWALKHSTLFWMLADCLWCLLLLQAQWCSSCPALCTTAASQGWATKEVGDDDGPSAVAKDWSRKPKRPTSHTETTCTLIFLWRWSKSHSCSSQLVPSCMQASLKTSFKSRRSKRSTQTTQAEVSIIAPLLCAEYT